MKEENQEGGWILILPVLFVGVWEWATASGINWDRVLTRLGESLWRVFTFGLWVGGAVLALWIALRLLACTFQSIQKAKDWKHHMDTTLSCVESDFRKLWHRTGSHEESRQSMLEELEKMEREIESLKIHTGLLSKQAVEDAAKQFSGGT